MKNERALVLGGGGAAGNAWEIGVIAGLFDAGVNVTDADLIIGTSAGATVAAQITSAIQPPDLFSAVLGEARDSHPSGHGPPSNRAQPNHMERTGAIINASSDAADMRRRLGAAALALDGASDHARQLQWRAIVAARLPSEQWPQRPMLITAVDARTGEPVVFDRHSAVDLVDAIAASTSSGVPYGIGDDRYIDGGYRANENADLAAGYSRVLVMSPFGGRSRHPAAWGTHLATQVDDLRAGGSRVETISPDSVSQKTVVVGMGVTDLSTRRVAAQSGYDQGRALAARLADFWR